MTSFGFKEMLYTMCLSQGVAGSKFIIMVSYVDDILLDSNDIRLLHETKNF